MSNHSADQVYWVTFKPPSVLGRRNQLFRRATTSVSGAIVVALLGADKSDETADCETTAPVIGVYKMGLFPVSFNIIQQQDN